MKVAPEEYLGMMVAVETSLKFDEKAEFERQLKTVNKMGQDLSTMPGVNTVTHIPGAEAREPYIEVQWDAGKYNIGVAEMKQALRDSRPSIEIRALFLSDGQLHLTAAMLKEGEPGIVTRRIAEIFRSST
jgi:seryl-tRNA(Sec) selenium transferase